MPLLDVDSLRTYFHTRSGIVRAVDGVSFALEKGETLAIVGESGSGKSVTCYSLLRLLPEPPARIESGSARFNGLDLLRCPLEELRKVRGKRISIIFQDPMTSLNPYLRVEDQIIEPLVVHDRMPRQQAVRQALAMLEEVGVPDAARCIRCYPHEFSGGMRQRVMIAASLITKPDLLIADEPTTALDVTVQAQILELIKREQRRIGMAVIFISHNLGVVAGVADQVLVMYAGRIMENAPVDRLFYHPQHPYSCALQKSIPAAQPKGAELYTIAGVPPDLSRPSSGCPFAPRCEFALEKCRSGDIPLAEVAAGHRSACLRVQAGEIRLEAADV